MHVTEVLEGQLLVTFHQSTLDKQKPSSINTTTLWDQCHQQIWQQDIPGAFVLACE